MDSDLRSTGGAVVTAVRKPRSKSWMAADHRKTNLIGLPVSDRMLDALERYRAVVGEDLSRPEVVRQILSKFLKENGFLKDRAS